MVKAKGMKGRASQVSLSEKALTRKGWKKYWGAFGLGSTSGESDGFNLLC